ncbi:unnamed protein product [Blepharisma stoltei]|uniref:DUF2817 domain-containing protein n=1 Tax=Blepharisma stoltei TaxID=1481888 RepID=A0AAU9IYX4_9CILI|nr:unnamed protein product [Blepharisma stoltei]
MNRSLQKCRDFFLNLSSRVPHRVQKSNYELPYIDFTGRPLSTDFLKIHKGSPKRWLLLTSGTHGVELFYGSALQSHVLKKIIDGSFQIPDNVGIIMGHAINPWGAAWLRRVNVNNIDLNRNFITDFPELLERQKTDPRYKEAKSIYLDTDEIINPGSPRFSNLYDGAKIAYYFWKYGREKFTYAMMFGQRFKSRGVQYGGKSMEIELKLLQEKIYELIPTDSEAVIHIDIHTGLGDPGQETFIVTDEESKTTTASIFGEKRVDFNSLFSGKDGGLIISGLKETKRIDGKWAAFALEIGTAPINKTFLSIRDEAVWHNANSIVENFSKKELSAFNSESYLNHKTKQVLVEMFCPSSEEWQKSSLNIGYDTVNHTIKYLSASK